MSRKTICLSAVILSNTLLKIADKTGNQELSPERAGEMGGAKEPVRKHY